MQTTLRRKIAPAEILFILLISGQFALYGFMWFRLLGDSSLKTMDFISFYGTGRLIRAGEYGRIYDIEAEALVQRRVAGPAYDQPLIFNHPPHITQLLALIAGDDYTRAYIYWTGAGLLAALAGAVLIYRFLLSSKWEPRLALFGAVGSMTYLPIFIGLLIGQDTIYSLLGLLVWMFALLKQDDAFAGLGLALATLSPTIAGALALPLLVSRRRAGLWFIVGVLVLGVYGFALVGFQGAMDFLHLLQLSSQGTYYGLNWNSMYNLLGFLLRAFPNWSSDSVRAVSWVASVGSIFLLCVLWWNQREKVSLRLIGLAVTLGVFTAPHLHLHGLSYLLLPLVGTAATLHARGNKTLALLFIPAVSSVLILFLFLLPAWNTTAYYLLMFALLSGFVALTPKESRNAF